MGNGEWGVLLIFITERFFGKIDIAQADQWFQAFFLCDMADILAK